MEDDLDGPGVVPQLDEDDAAKVAAAANPSVGPNRTPRLGRPEVPAQRRTLPGFIEKVRPAFPLFFFAETTHP